MDIQSILKQVISLAEVVIKNPSTSVKNSGIDLSSIAQVAGSLLGNNSSSGLGSILGGLASAASSSSNSSSGGLGSILGGLASAAASSSSSSSSGGLGSILGGLAGTLNNGSGSVNAQSSNGDLLGQLISKAGTIKEMLSGTQSQNLNSEQKTNLTDVLNIINVAKNFVK